MKKILAISMTALLIVVLAMSLCACKNPSNDFWKPADELSSWMDNIVDTAPFRKVAIPGTHDSGTIGMMSLAETQRASIGDQLKMGVRYFDIRVSEGGKGGVIFHGPIKGTDFQPIADDIKSFMDTSPSETLILDFQHFDGEGAPKLVYDTLHEKGLLDIAVNNNSKNSDLEYIDSLKMADVRGKVIIFFGNDMADKYTNIFRRNNDGCTIEGASLDSLYKGELHKRGSLNFCDEALPEYMEHIIAKDSGILVLQGQLTAPNLLTSPYSIEQDHRDNMLAYIKDNIRNNEQYLAHVGVIMRDFVEEDMNKVTSIIALNYYKDYVRSDRVAGFKVLCSIK